MNKKKEKRRNKFFKREVILEKLAEAGEIGIKALLNSIWGILAFSSAMILPYHQSYRALKRLPYNRPYISIDLKSKIAFWSLLSKLEKENLIAKRSSGKIIITSMGKEYLETKSQTPSWFKYYKPVINSQKDQLNLIIFDIPEKERLKRDWLRHQLKILGFKRLQDSVFLSNNLLPKDFIKDLQRYQIFLYVHIFSVNKKGTLSKFLRRS